MELRCDVLGPADVARLGVRGGPNKTDSMTCFRDRLIVGGVKKIKESGIAAPWGNKESGRVCLVADEQQVSACACADRQELANLVEGGGA